MDSLLDGGPLSIELDRRGADIGRDTYLDWTLPDAQRFISGKHCEVRYRDGGYWLHDVSTNGTMVNDNAGRLTEPYLLKNGDRIHIGDYIIAVELDGSGAADPPPEQAQPQAPTGDLWGGFSNVAPTVGRGDVTPVSTPQEVSGRPVLGDVMEEEISWSVGEVESPSTEQVDVDWATPVQPDRVQSTPVPSAPASQPAPPPPQASPFPSAPPPAEEPPLELGTPVVPAEPHTAPSPEPSPGPPPEPFQAQPQRQSGLARQWQDEPAAEPSPQPSPAPPPAPADTPAPPQAAPVPQSAAPGASWVDAFERGAGLPPGSVARNRGDEALAAELGLLFRIVAENLKAMLVARDETKNAMRSTQRTMIQAMENNPLKFSPSAEDALRIMFGEKVSSYLDARQTLEASFDDLKSHQMMTFNAMQMALQALIEDLDPEKIAEGTASEGGLAGLVSSRRAKLWDMYTERYKAKAARHERGLIDAFMILFAQMYDQQGRR